MRNNIRWLLTEAKLSNLDTNKINLVGNKLICYHLTSHRKWGDYNPKIQDMIDNPIVKHPKQERSDNDSRAMRIVKNLKDSDRISLRDTYDIEEKVIMDMISDPYTDTSGFSAGGGDYHGKGLYTCYKFNPEIAWHYGNICLVFEIDISNFIITFEDLAKQVHGEDWRIKDQLLKLYQLEERSPESIETYKKVLSEIPDNELEMSKTIYSSTGRTANISLSLMRRLSKLLITSFYEGIILLGDTDGPVCVSFYPKYDAKLIGLGRLNEDSPEIVDWYDSLDDFLGGRAKLKQDFETLNSIAEEITDPAEKAEMKSEDRPPFDMEYLEITTFFNGDSRYVDSTVDKMFELYNDIKSSGDTRKFEFFLKSFKNSRYPFEDSAVKSPEYNELIDEVINYYKKQNKNLDASFFSAVLESYLVNNLTATDLFLTSGIDVCLNDKTFKQNSWTARAFDFKIKKYLKINSVSSKVQSLLDEKLNEFGPNMVIMSRRAEKIAEFYANTDEINKNKIISMLIDELPQAGTIYWKEVTPENFNAANNILENIIDSLIKNKPNFNYEFNFVRYLYNDLPDVKYFSNKIDEFIASSFLNNMDEIKKDPNTSFFINTIKYIKRKLGSSHPTVLEAESLVSLSKEQAANDIEMFIEKLNMGQITSRKLKDKIGDFKDDLSYVSYLSSQSKDWFRKLFDAVIKNITVKNFKVLGKAETAFLLAIIMSHDIALTKEEQFAFTRKFGKSDYGNKNDIANYKHLDPDVFIELLGPDLAKGGMGAGLSFKGYEYSPGIYRLLYKHRKVVDLFCEVAKPGLMKMIILNINDELSGKSKPTHTWGDSGMLRSNGISYYLGTLPYLGFPVEQIKISDAINMNDISWFEYFANKAKDNPGRGLKKPIAALEQTINSKKPTQTDKAQDSLDPQLDLSHRKIFGNSLKEIYKF